jgi:hypothetical protein
LTRSMKRLACWRLENAYELSLTWSSRYFTQ